MTGMTKAKKRIKKVAGITAATKPLRYKTNLERKAKRKVGYYSTPGKMLRNKKAPTPVGCVVPMMMLFAILTVLVAHI